ncbi:hypothetical protein LTR37_011229 [Vermiconidia calcicola]|uniref:Uncharacterized protein n=1 Tax=Vermiconidia calcicola TaxID=1690605 RepID=A0ACC3N2W0_9PEZI|nr:hypothetical protein LTR37_011229 [Vermiconidia calcicola]
MQFALILTSMLCFLLPAMALPQLTPKPFDIETLPAVTTYDEKDCGGNIVWDFKHDTRPGVCYDTRVEGVRSIQLWIPTQEVAAAFYTHWLPGCPGSDFRKADIPYNAVGHFLCIDAINAQGKLTVFN